MWASVGCVLVTGRGTAYCLCPTELRGAMAVDSVVQVWQVLSAG